MRAKTMKTMRRAVALSVTVGTMLASNGMVANAQPKEMKDGTVFDAEYYARKYADVAAACGTDEASLFQHYTVYGKAENREAVEAPGKAVFDADYYANANPDVVAVYGTGSNNLYQHYLQHGKDEGRSPVATAGKKENTAATVSAPKAETPPATDTPAAAPALATLSVPAATVKIETGGGFSFDGSSIWCQTYDSGKKMTGGHIGWDGELQNTAVESTDAYGVTYRSYAFKNMDPAKNVQSAKNALADYLAANPDSDFTALVKGSGSEIVIVTYPALFPNGIEGCKKYPDIDLLAWDYFLVDGKMYILCADNTFDWLEGTPRPDVYIPQYLNGAFNSVSSLLK